jgi:hypothetical protein
MSGLSDEALWESVRRCLKEEIEQLIDDDQWHKVVDQLNEDRDIKVFAKNIPGLAFIRIYIHMDKEGGRKYIDERVMARYFVSYQQDNEEIDMDEFLGGGRESAKEWREH